MKNIFLKLIDILIATVFGIALGYLLVLWWA